MKQSPKPSFRKAKPSESIASSPRMVAQSITSLGSFTINKALSTKKTAFKTQLIIYSIVLVCSILSLVGTWLVFDRPSFEEPVSYHLFSYVTEKNALGVTRVYISPVASQICGILFLVFGIIGWLFSVIVSYTRIIPHHLMKYALALIFFSSWMVFFLGIATHLGFESGIYQVFSAFASNNDISNTDISGRGYGYALMIVSYVLAIPLIFMTGQVYLAELRGRWEVNFRNSIRKSFGAGAIPEWIQSEINRSSQRVDSVEIPTVDNSV